MRTIVDKVRYRQLAKARGMQKKVSGVDTEWAPVRPRASGIWRRPGAQRAFASTPAQRALPALRGGARWALLLLLSLGVAGVVLGTLFSLTEQLLELGRTAANSVQRAP